MRPALVRHGPGTPAVPSWPTNPCGPPPLFYDFECVLHKMHRSSCFRTSVRSALCWTLDLHHRLKGIPPGSLDQCSTRPVFRVRVRFPHSGPLGATSSPLGQKPGRSGVDVLVSGPPLTGFEGPGPPNKQKHVGPLPASCGPRPPCGRKHNT